MTTPVRKRQPLPDISSRAWEHPADRGALVALRKLKGFDTRAQAAVRPVQRAGGPAAVPRLGDPGRRAPVPPAAPAARRVAATLDAPELPELYVAADPVANAITIGMDKPFIVVNSGLVDLLDEEELRFVLGHELGHALSGHAVYQTLLLRLISLSGVLTPCRSAGSASG